MEIQALLTSICTMGVIIGIGALIASRTPLTAETRQFMITIIVNVAMPFIILYGIFSTPIDQQLLTQIFLIFIVSVLFNCLGIGMGMFGATMLRFPRQKVREMAIVSGLGNTGFIGLPLCAALFGPKGALLAAVFDAGLDFTIWTVGVMLLQNRQGFRLKNLQTLINPPMIAIVVGLFIAAIGFHPPQLVKQLSGILANLASPMAMLYIGMLIPTLLKNRRNISLSMLGLPITIKLFIFPLVVAGLLYASSLDADITQVVLIQATMPTIAMASILFAKYAADEEMGAMTTVCSTLLALATIPAVVLVGNLILHQ